MALTLSLSLARWGNIGLRWDKHHLLFAPNFGEWYSPCIRHWKPFRKQNSSGMFSVVFLIGVLYCVSQRCFYTPRSPLNAAKYLYCCLLTSQDRFMKRIIRITYIIPAGLNHMMKHLYCMSKKSWPILFRAVCPRSIDPFYIVLHVQEVLDHFDSTVCLRRFDPFYIVLYVHAVLAHFI